MRGLAVGQQCSLNLKGPFALGFFQFGGCTVMLITEVGGNFNFTKLWEPHLNSDIIDSGQRTDRLEGIA